MLFVPGTVVLRLLGARGTLALGAAPALSCAFYAAAAPVLAATGIAWGAVSVGISLLLVVLVLVAGRRLVRPAGRSAPDAPRAPVSWLGAGAVDALVAHRRWFVVAVAVGSVVAVVPMAIGMGDPAAPLQQWDAVFHLNGVAFIRETGVASTINGLYGAGNSVYYPTVWHSMVALVPGDLVTTAADAITSAANASSLVMGSVAWLVGLGAFGAACFPRRPEIAVLAVAVGGAFSMFPTVIFSTLAQWPNGLSVMLVPGAAALWVTLLRSTPDVGRSRRAVLCGTALVALVGVGSAHGSGVVGLAVVVGPLAILVAVRAVRHAWMSGRRRAVLLLGAVVLGLAVTGTSLVMQSTVMHVLFSFERLPQRGYAPSVVRTLLDTVMSAWPGNILVSVAVLVGVVVLVRSRDQRWLLVSAGTVVVLVALAAGPSTPLRALTGVWYTQAARIEALYPIVAAVLAAVGFVALGSAASRVARRRAPRGWETAGASSWAAVLVVVALVTSLGFQAPGRSGRFAEAYDPAQIRWGTMLSVEEIALMRELREIVPPGSVILGDPHNGTAFAFSMGGTHAVLPQLGTSAMDEAQTYLREHFRDIESDPEVCRYVEELGVTHFYEDEAGELDGAKVDPESPGLHDVDTSTGFSVVAVAGTATLLTIDACS
ncbi:DUF6541 family protein [Sanguibacter antarcticus]|uniref:DUF6541 family protein n=1 Tax=Sanguibacter antarcticus TaxID=372484 RepID=UPI000BF2D337|nr:DUF6541 family protein [Sanguibacter antarcticus]